jgi:hypothetical protein
MGMKKYKPVSISTASFAFCRYTVAVMVWASFFLKSEWLLGAVLVIFILNAILKVKRAPLILLYDVTVGRIKKSPEILVNEHSLFFAHSLAALLSLVCLVSVLSIHNGKIWYGVLAFALLKTVSAAGFCPASCLYDYLSDGSCCKMKV